MELYKYYQKKVVHFKVFVNLIIIKVHNYFINKIKSLFKSLLFLLLRHFHVYICLFVY